jgi:hypothetical protein
LFRSRHFSIIISTGIGTTLKANLTIDIYKIKFWGTDWLRAKEQRIRSSDPDRTKIIALDVIQSGIADTRLVI